MNEPFTYYALYRRDHRTDPPLGLLAEGRVDPDRARRVVGWDHRSRTWTEAGADLSEITLNPDYEDRFTIVDRSTAERIARESLRADLPTEAELQQIGDRAAAERRGRGPAT